MNIYQDKYGGWRTKPSLLTTLGPYAKALIIGSLISLVVVGVCHSVYMGRNERPISVGHQETPPSNEEDRKGEVGSDCVKTGERAWDCTDEVTKDRVYEAAKKGITWHYQEEKQNTFKASVTKYSRKDSCHNPKGEACLTASGEDTKEGRTVACPRSLKLGTKVLINGKTYTCLDRTAKWVEAKFGPTYDIFTEDHAAALRFGRKTLEVAILK